MTKKTFMEYCKLSLKLQTKVGELPEGQKHKEKQSLKSGEYDRIQKRKKAYKRKTEKNMKTDKERSKKVGEKWRK